MRMVWLVKRWVGRGRVVSWERSWDVMLLRVDIVGVLCVTRVVEVLVGEMMMVDMGGKEGE
jgi:hypothetical protein